MTIKMDDPDIPAAEADILDDEEPSDERAGSTPDTNRHISKPMCPFPHDVVIVPHDQALENRLKKLSVVAVATSSKDISLISAIFSAV